MTSINVPTCNQIAASLEGSARIVAAVLVAVYVAGATLRDWVAGVATFAKNLTEQPLQTLLDLIPTVEPEPSVLDTLGAILLDPEALELEIAAYDEAAKPAKRPSARRKPAKATQDLVAA
jgi:hypothetical protein